MKYWMEFSIIYLFIYLFIYFYIFTYFFIYLFTCSFVDFLCSWNLQEGMDKPPSRRLGLQAGREPAPNLMQNLVVGLTIRVLKIAERGHFFKCPQGPWNGGFYAPQSVKFRKRGTFPYHIIFGNHVMCARKHGFHYFVVNQT